MSIGYTTVEAAEALVALGMSMGKAQSSAEKLAIEIEKMAMEYGDLSESVMKHRGIRQIRCL